MSLIAFMFLGLTSLVGRGFLAIILCFITVCLIKCIKYLNKIECLSVFLLLTLNVIYYVFGDKNVSGVETTGFFSNIVLCLGIFFVSFYFSKQKSITDNQIIVVFSLLLLVTSYRFVVERAEKMLLHEDRRLTMNLAYSFVIYSPVLFLIRKKIIAVPYLLISLFMIVTGAKRGAILIFVLFLAYYIYNMYVRQIKKFKIKYFLLGIILLTAVMMVAYNAYQTNVYLQMRVENTMAGDSNGREIYYRYIWDKWSSEGNPIHFLFGYGFCSSIPMIGNHAHNDWMELMATSGLLGLCIYLFFYGTLISYRNRMNHNNDWYVLSSIIFVLFTKSLFSMSYCSVENMAIFFLLGYVLGKNETKLAFISKKRI